MSFTNVFLMVFMERKGGITGVPFGRADLSIGWIGTTFLARLHRHGPVGPSFQGMPEKFDFHVFLFDFFFRLIFMKSLRSMVGFRFFPQHLCFGSPFLRPCKCQSRIMQK